MKHACRRSLLPATLLAGVLVVAAPPLAAAQGIPVVDNASIAQIVLTLTELQNIYGRQNLELTEALRLTRSIVGCAAPPCNLGLGTLHQTPELRRIRRSLPRLMRDLNRLGEQGADPNLARSMALHGELTDRYALLDADAYQPGDPEAPYAQAWRADQDAQLAAAVTSEITYENLAQRQDLYDQLTTELNTRDSVKESVDILAHLTAENGRLLMELIRLQATATQADATNQLARQTQAAAVRRMADYEDLDMADWMEVEDDDDEE